jgi:putative membrane protein insertion efficiency factor
MRQFVNCLYVVRNKKTGSMYIMYVSPCFLISFSYLILFENLLSAMRRDESRLYEYFMKYILNIPRNFFVFLIRIYQKTLSPDHSPFFRGFFPGGFCKYCPSCSEYSAMAAKKHGFFRGVLKSCGRVLRCHPWSKGGLDLP